MSYPSYQGGPYGGPQQGYPPQQGYNQGPPPQGHSTYPQQGYGPPPGQYPPQQGYPPQQQHQGYPPQQQWGNPPQQQFGQPPQGYPPQQYNQSRPNQGYGPPTDQYPAQQYGPPGGQYGAPMPDPPTPGYGPTGPPQVDANFAADELRKAMKGLGTDEATLIRILCHYQPTEVVHLKNTFQQRHHRSLENDIKKETSGYFETGLLAILRGPLSQDAHVLNYAIKGAGTNEKMLNDVLIGRKNADLRAVTQAYNSTYNKNLQKEVSEELSMKTERLFSMILAANRQEESAPVIPQNVEQDVGELHRAMGAKVGTDQMTVCSILATRSNGQIRAIAQTYENRYRQPLETTIKNEFSGHMQEALVQMVRAACDPAMRDAIRLEDCMAGPGTKDELLVSRLVSMHWDRNHMQQVKGAYRHRYNKDLIARIKGETSGNYERLLVAMCE